MAKDQGHQETSVGELSIRSFQPDDQGAVQRLYETGSLAGQTAPRDSDTGADIDHVQEAYFGDERHHFWVAQKQDRVVGTIGVMSDDDNTAEIRRLRVQPDLQGTGIAAALLETAIEHCRRHGFLKVRLDTAYEKGQALDQFEKIGFQHTRSKNVQGKELLEFYLDLYRDPQHRDEG